MQLTNSWPEMAFPQGYWRSDGFSDQWTEDEPHLYMLTGTSGTRWPTIPWKRKAKTTPDKYKVPPICFDEKGRMRPRFCWTIPPHSGPKISEIMVHGWYVSGTKGSLTRLVYEASVLHTEGHLIHHLVFLAKPAPADALAGQIKPH